MNHIFRRCIAARICLPVLSLVAVQIVGLSYAAERPPIHIRPELYLGWRQEQKPPKIKRLPWQLEIVIQAVDSSGIEVAGPLKVNTREEFAGISFMLTEPEESADDSADNAGDSASVSEAIQSLQSLDFAVQVVPEGANLINLRCYVKLHTQKSGRLADYQTMATLECRPGRRTVLAEFPGLKLYLTADWKGPVIN